MESKHMAIFSHVNLILKLPNEMESNIWQGGP